MLPPNVIDFTPPAYEILMYRGDDFSLALYHLDGDGIKQPLEGVDFEAVVCRKSDGAVVLKFSGEGALGETRFVYADKEVEFFVSKANSMSVLPGTHFFDIQSNYGGTWRTYMAGEFKVVNRAKPQA